MMDDGGRPTRPGRSVDRRGRRRKWEPQVRSHSFCTTKKENKTEIKPRREDGGDGSDSRRRGGTSSFWRNREGSRPLLHRYPELREKEPRSLFSFHRREKICPFDLTIDTGVAAPLLLHAILMTTLTMMAAAAAAAAAVVIGSCDCRAIAGA
ncbi:hypothetical protein ACJRO7_007932 [Eucalyptus globulus]|uniref:Uncharacterized protein n=1 Tax=Eucalyptus globulus TaxID=34317 RepID=A0ABD3IPZ0_EUCGL